MLLLPAPVFPIKMNAAIGPGLRDLFVRTKKLVKLLVQGHSSDNNEAVKWTEDGLPYPLTVSSAEPNDESFMLPISRKLN